MDKADVMRLVKRGPHSTSCWAWRGLLAEGGFPTITKGKIDDPGLILGAPSIPRRCKNRLCVNPAHREGAQKKPYLPPAPKPRPKPNTKARTLKLVSKQTEAAKAQTPPTPLPASHTPEPKATPKPKTKTQCNNGHPKTPENTWTSPSTGKSKCKLCEKESKARSKAKKAAKK